VKTNRATLSAALGALFLFTAGVLAEPASQPAGATGSADWPCWRGPTHDGVASAGPRLLDSWPKEGPKQVWKSEWIQAFDTASGVGSPVVADGKVYVYVSWHHPEGTKDEKHFRPFTPEILRDWGYIPDMPEDLAQKIEDARIAADRPKCDRGYHLLEWWWPEKRQEESVAALMKKQPAFEKYVNDFLATLDPKDAAKYGSYIKRRLAFEKGEHTPTRELLKAFDAALRDKEFQSLQEMYGAIDKNKFKFDWDLTVRNDAWNRTSRVTDTAICLDGAKGKELWKKEFPTTNDWVGMQAGEWFGSASTPAVWGGKMYLIGLKGLYCLSARDGELLWQKPGRGCHGSVLVADGVVIDGGDGCAYDAQTGRLLWKGCGAGNSSPVLWASGGKNYVICGGTCLDLHTGKVAWKAAGMNIGYGLTPVVSGDILVGVGCAFKITPEKAELLWKETKGIGFDPSASPVVYQDHLYQFHSWYGGGDWYCVDVKTGQMIWKDHSKLKNDCVCSSSVVVDGKIIHPLGGAHAMEVYQVEMLQANPEKCVSLGVFSPGVAMMSSPAVANGKLYLRLSDGVACYDLTEAGNK
jgi:outer membrane protein assembly factor BamB